MNTLKVALGLAVGGYWVYLVQSRKDEIENWEYWAGLGAGAYWAWLALSSPDEKKQEMVTASKQAVATPAVAASPPPASRPSPAPPPPSTTTARAPKLPTSRLPDEGPGKDPGTEGLGRGMW